MNSLVTVIQLAVPPALATFEEYEERTKTLHHFAATSKRLHSLAVRELCDVVRVQKDKGCLAGPVTTEERGQLAKVLILAGAEAGLFDDFTDLNLESDEISRLVLFTPEVAELSIHNSHALDLSSIQPLRNLTSLVIYGCDMLYLPERADGLSFRHVTTLSLYSFIIMDQNRDAILSPELFPALRHLGVTHAWSQHPNDEEGQDPDAIVFSNTSLPFLSQLTTMRCPAEMLPTNLILPPAVRILRVETVAVSYLRQPLSYAASVPHLALLPHADHHYFPAQDNHCRDPKHAATASKAFRELSKSIKAAVQANNLYLRLVLLDKAFSTSASPPVFRDARAALLECCAGVGIEVLQAEKPEYGHESIVSKQFITWCEEKYA